MMLVPFVKYHGAGNDFILIDDRESKWSDLITNDWVAKVCHRRFGIGADGLILLQPGKDDADFFMKYYNSDGNTSTFCGNGGRCIAAFAGALGIKNGRFHFLGTDGWHDASINADGTVTLGMMDVNQINKEGDEAFTVFTGSPHYVTFVKNIDHLDVPNRGRSIRYSPPFDVEGINVNFVETLGQNEIRIRTYERGVEDETMACGTGVVAAALVSAFITNDHSGKCIVHAQGGDLKVEFTRNGEQSFQNILLIGPAIEVFRGEISLD